MKKSGWLWALVVLPSMGRAIEHIPLKSAEPFVKVRCHLGGEERYLVWEGSAYSQHPEERQRHLFDYVGINVARCLQKSDGSWFLTSREMMIYTDPATGEVLHNWTNPWTGETVPVVHVANDLVQVPINLNRFALTIQHFNGHGVVETDINLTYPNPLAGQPFEAYSPQPMYQASELTKWHFLMADLEGADQSVEQVAFGWTRTSPWLPWMKMSDTKGFMTFSAWGMKTDDPSTADPRVRQFLDGCMQAYLHAPTCWLDEPNSTSFTYFKQHFQAYLEGQSFPVKEPIRTCPKS